MKIVLQEHVDVEFDRDAINKGRQLLNEIKSRYSGSGDIESVFGGIFTILLFMQLEKNQPGITDSIRENVKLLSVSPSELKGE